MPEAIIKIRRRPKVIIAGEENITGAENNVPLYDQHLHSHHSVDSKADPAQNVRHAIEIGLDGVTFTEHYDAHPSEWPVCIYDYDRIAQTVNALRTDYGDRIFIGHGIEICYQPAQEAQILEHLSTHAFDLVLLSVHWFDGRALHERDHWEGLTPEVATRRYLEAVLEAVGYVRQLKARGQDHFDILGHLDLVKRYTQRYFGTYDIASQADLVDAILRACLETDLIPEVNLSSLFQSLPEPMPADWVVRRYAELGGRAMTLGSDAHAPARVGHKLKEGAEMLKAQGINYLAVFKQRQRSFVPL